MAPVVAEIALENRNTFAVAKMNVADSRQTTGKYQVRAHPTYIVFQGGKIVGRSAGVMPKNQLLQRILSAINN
jgi:thioredoxin 1